MLAIGMLLTETGPVEPEVTPADEEELCRLIAEADRLQMLISSYMSQVHQDLEMAPHLRRATTAYTEAGVVLRLTATRQPLRTSTR